MRRQRAAQVAQQSECEHRTNARMHSHGRPTDGKRWAQVGLVSSVSSLRRPARDFILITWLVLMYCRYYGPFNK